MYPPTDHNSMEKSTASLIQQFFCFTVWWHWSDPEHISAFLLWEALVRMKTSSQQVQNIAGGRSPFTGQALALTSGTMYVQKPCPYSRNSQDQKGRQAMRVW